MATPEDLSTTVGARTPNLPRVILVVTTSLVLLLVVVNMFVVVPAYRALMAGAGAVFSLPAQLAISISHFGALILLAGVVALGIAFQRERRGAAGAFSLALGMVGLLATLYLGLVCTVYLDFARIAGHIH